MGRLRPTSTAEAGNKRQLTSMSIFASTRLLCVMTKMPPFTTRCVLDGG